MINVIHFSLATALSACTLNHHLSSRIVLKVVSKGHRDRVIAVVALVRSRNPSNDTSQSCSRRNRPIYATSTRLRMEPPGNCAGKFSCLDGETEFWFSNPSHSYTRCAGTYGGFNGTSRILFPQTIAPTAIIWVPKYQVALSVVKIDPGIFSFSAHLSRPLRHCIGCLR